jgi:hypothetical protein
VLIDDRLRQGLAHALRNDPPRAERSRQQTSEALSSSLVADRPPSNSGRNCTGYMAVTPDPG